MSDSLTLEKHFDYKTEEKRLYQQWEQDGYFACDLTRDGQSERETFVQMMPPPNVTGNLHLGHALTFGVEDVVTRFQRLLGKDVLWQPGLDHAGIATQMVVEKQLAKEGKTRHDLGRETFLERVWQWKEESGGKIVDQQRRLGCSPDWQRSRFTMEEHMSYAVRHAFVTMFKDGLIYRGKRLVNWDPHLQSAISDIEVNNEPRNGQMWYLQYPLADDSGEKITVATTRPETMLGDTAVIVHPEDERYKSFIGKEVMLPIVGRRVPIIADDYVDPEGGSGAMKVTPAHDFNDFDIGERHSLPMINIFDKTACINENAPESYRGLNRDDARKKVVAEFDALGLLEKTEPHQNTIPISDRSGDVVEPLLTEQWFVHADKLAGPAIEAIENGDARFIPKQWENMYFHWMRNIQPWCISRQLWWGHQIPIWYGPDNTQFCAMDVDDAQQQAQAHYDTTDTVELRQETDVLDTWFSSSLWPFATLGWPHKTPELDRYFPGNFLDTGFDIITFWVSRMLMMGIYFMGETPFKDIYIHALVRDEKGQKMSKSKGNVIDPMLMMDEYGVDAVRMTLMAFAAQGRDIRMSPERIAGYRNFVTKIWNASRFALMNGARIDTDFDPLSVKHATNQWILLQLDQITQLAKVSYRKHIYNNAANDLYQFMWNTFCDWYLELTKPLLDEEATDEALKAETRATMAYVLQETLVMLHPIMPFITDTIVQTLRNDKTHLIQKRLWPDFRYYVDEETKDRFVAGFNSMNFNVHIITKIRSLRADLNLPASAKLDVKIQFNSEQQRTYSSKAIEDHKETVIRMARLASIEVLPKGAPEPERAARAVLSGGTATALIVIDESIDLAPELARLGKAVAETEGEIKKLRGKLANENFVSRAPTEVVDEQKNRLAEAEETLERLSQAHQTVKQLAG